jgi:DnaJ-class molecular chaperone
MEHRDLYETLGVGHDDRALAVRHAYRDLARLSHATTRAVPRFVQEIDIALQVLSDQGRRARYDSRVASAGEEVAAHGAAEHRLDLLRDFEGGRPSQEEVWHAFRCNFAPGTEPKSARVDVLAILIRVSGPVSSSGPDVLAIELPLFHPCARCHGSGSVAWCGCAACAGTGMAETRATVRVPATASERVLSLESLGVRTPILHLRVTAEA